MNQIPTSSRLRDTKSCLRQGDVGGAGRWLDEAIEELPHIWVKWDADDEMWVCGDQIEGEFARATSIEGLIPYICDLAYDVPNAVKGLNFGPKPGHLTHMRSNFDNKW